jgi:tRNA (uracil-5-)-methyltransferase
MPLPIADPARYDAQLEDKVRLFRAEFARFDPPAPQVHRSAPLHYRLRAEFRIWHRGGHGDDSRCSYVMFAPEAPETPIDIDSFPIGALRINQLMPVLLSHVNSQPALSRRLFQVEFLTTLSGETLVTLIYHRKLDPAWQQAALQLREQLNTGDSGTIGVMGRSRGQKVVLDRDHVTETLDVAGRTLHYRQIEGSFTQPNGGINRQMLEWASEQTSSLGGDLLELYCGNGNFTIALAPNFNRVLATEIAKSSVRAAQHNLAANGIDTVSLVRMSSEEISTALSGGRAFRRLRDIPLDEYRFSTLLVDPPRSGLDETTLALARRFDNILYISCNPQTLHANIAALQSSHRMGALALFDQFPYTHHLECGVLLQRSR